MKGFAMNWILLVLAGLLEIVWAVGLKYTDGFTRLWPTVITVLAMLVSLALLGVVMRSLPVSTAYAVWMGIGVVGTAILGIMVLGEPATFGRLFSIALILVGVIGLKLTT
jgi:quaternary ammonium compound-resistance protein SugE